MLQYVKSGGHKITSTNSLKILGYVFGTQPNAWPHVEYMLDKARRKLWTLRHLKKSGMEQSDLLKIFETIIRPTLEYASPTYHPMLNKEMSDQIENIQRRACKIIFGWDSNYSTLLEEGRIETLSSRRETLTVNFAEKTSKNERFKHWFPLRTNESEVNLRRQNKYEECYARTERMKNSPLFYMRRALNYKLREEALPAAQGD